MRESDLQNKARSVAQLPHRVTPRMVQQRHRGHKEKRGVHVLVVVSLMANSKLVFIGPGCMADYSIVSVIDEICDADIRKSQRPACHSYDRSYLTFS